MARLFAGWGTKALDTDVAANRRWATTARRLLMPGQPAFSTWSAERAVQDGTERDIWAFRAVHMLALGVARLPVVLRDGDPWNGALLKGSDDPILRILNRRANGMEFGKMFRYRLTWQLSISKPGVFIERVISRRGDLLALKLLPLDITKPVPDVNGRLDHFKVSMPDGSSYKIPPEDVCWIRWPHPTDPWTGMTPFEALGISIDTSFAARLYNRRFLAKDGRPAGLVAIKGQMADDELDELSRRFSGMGGVGDIAFIEDPEGGFQWQDFGAKPRDMAYPQLRGAMKEEILVGVGTPEGIAGNTSGRTFDNMDAEREGWYVDGVMPTAEVIADALTPWTADGEEGNHCLGYDVSHIAVLGRHQRERDSYMLTEWLAGLITDDEYRDATGRDPLDDAQREHLYQAAQRPATPGAPASDQPIVEGGALRPPILPKPASLASYAKDDTEGKAGPRKPRGRWVAAT